MNEQAPVPRRGHDKVLTSSRNPIANGAIPRMTTLLRAATAMAAVLLVTGCASTNPTTVSGQVTSTHRAVPQVAPDKVYQFLPSDVSSSCEADMHKAAGVPMGKSNDKELLQSAQDCSTLDEWGAAVNRNPKALNMAGAVPDSYLTTDVEVLCGSVAAAGLSSPLCGQAERLGLKSN